MDYPDKTHQESVEDSKDALIQQEPQEHLDSGNARWSLEALSGLVGVAVVMN